MQLIGLNQVIRTNFGINMVITLFSHFQKEIARDECPHFEYLIYRRQTLSDTILGSNKCVTRRKFLDFERLFISCATEAQLLV